MCRSLQLTESSKTKIYKSMPNFIFVWFQWSHNNVNGKVNELVEKNYNFNFKIKIAFLQLISQKQSFGQLSEKSIALEI